MSLIIILITIGVSVYAFSRVKLMDQLSLKPVQIVHRGQWYRLFSHALVHADYVHLLVNMYVLWIFGSVCEQYFQFFFVVRPGLIFVLLYLLSLYIVIAGIMPILR